MDASPFRRLGGLWRHPDFVRLWIGQTVSVFGTLVTRVALPLTAVLVLGAGPAALAALALAELVPAFAAGLFAGAWVDRLPKRPLMIGCDLGRAALLVLIPLAAWRGVLGLWVLGVVAVGMSVLNIVFEVAYEAYLPVLVTRDELVEGNSKLTATAAIAEFASFGTAGWLVQLFTAPLALLVDAVSYLGSAAFLVRIRAPEPPAIPHADRAPLLGEVAEGLRFVAGDGVLRSLAIAGMVVSFSFRLTGTLWVLWVTKGLGFAPSAQGMIYALGGLSSLAGAMMAARVARRWGVGRTLAGTMAVGGVGQLFVPLAPGATPVGMACLVAQQLITDPAITVFDIHLVSQRQGLTPQRLLGRMNASMRFLDFGAMLCGAALAGLAGEAFGPRAVLFAGAFTLLAGAVWLARSPAGALRAATG
jgi:hypothetical protein